MQVAPKTASFMKISALVSFSMELLTDFADFQAFVPSDLSRLVINEETRQIIAGSGTGNDMVGLISEPGVLTRTPGQDSPGTPLSTPSLV